MIINQFANELIREIDDKIEMQTDEMRRGIRERDEYWRVVGLTQGLEAMKFYIKDLANRAEREDDD